VIQPQRLRPHYSAFLKPNRVLLTGHSHQAWPDVARSAVLAAFDDAALHVDDKWSRVLEQADTVRAHIAGRIGAEPDQIVLGANTHELVARFLSGLPWSRRRHLVTTTGEFHSLRRQLLRLEEEGVEVTWVEASPLHSLAERMAAAVRTDTAAVLASTVLFATSSVVPDLQAVTEAAHRVGAAVLFDAYHAFDVLPFSVADLGADPVFVVAGGYKYAQWGEGCCWMRVPAGTRMRPVFTGWFAEFDALPNSADQHQVGYSPRGADRFAGSTFEPTSIYRAAAVAAFFEAQQLDVATLRSISMRQTGRLVEALHGAFEVCSPLPAAHRAGFVTVRIAQAGEIVRQMRARGVYVDARGDCLRLGPAPYVLDDALDHAVATLKAVTAKVLPSKADTHLR
jgi:selenocysteine lyase/cysteine desulfurase